MCYGNDVMLYLKYQLIISPALRKKGDSDMSHELCDVYFWNQQTETNVVFSES